MAKITRALLLVTIMLTSLLHAQALDIEARAKQEPTCNADRTANWTVGMIQCNDNLSDGYTLFSPMPTSTAYLIDNEGREIHNWTSPGGHRPGMSAYLLDDGSLLRTANIADTAVGNFSGGGTAGKVERISWEGELLWSYEYSSTEYISHHDIEPMPNGNVLMIAWESKNDTEGAQAGRNPAIASDAPGGSNGVWPDKIVEIQPNGTSGGDVVWSWYAWDHLVQDYDPMKDNYGVVADHPELLDINFVDATGAQAGKADWMHCNGIDYNPLLDQIALSCKNMNEIYIIDHSTTTEEAAGHTGGAYGKGGDFLYRWGNPEAYDSGTSKEKRLYGQHDVQWIEQDRPGAGSLIVYNNGVGRPDTYSSVDVITPVVIDGEYQLDDANRFLPDASSWSWDLGAGMYAGFISGAERLSNGNTLVTYGPRGTLYEVDLGGEIVWTYINPVTSQGIIEQGEPLPNGNQANSKANPVFKARKYTADHPALSGRTLTPGTYIEPWIDACPEVNALPWDRDGDGCIDDSDADGVLDPEDECPDADDSTDTDNDGLIDGCDPFVDADEDGVEDSNDACLGYDDAVDIDEDGTPDGCDPLIDSDGDGVEDSADACLGHDDAVDVDQDGAPDGCDELIDTDADGVADSVDACPGFDDGVDEDDDGTPDGCDEEVTIQQTQDYTIEVRLGYAAQLEVTLRTTGMNDTSALAIRYTVEHKAIDNDGQNSTIDSQGEVNATINQSTANQTFYIELESGAGGYCVTVNLRTHDVDGADAPFTNSSATGCVEVEASHFPVVQDASSEQNSDVRNRLLWVALFATIVTLGIAARKGKDGDMEAD
jgi:hypothetical protein